MLKKILTALAALVLVINLGGLFVMNLKWTALNNAITAKTTPATSEVTMGQCGAGGYCLKFKHESELYLPPVTATVNGCEPYKLPVAGDLPAPNIDLPPLDGSGRAVNMLLQYIEKVLDTDRQNKAALLNNYQEYLDACNKGKEAPPSTSTK